MTFKEIEQAVVKHLPLEDGTPLHEQMCYSTLRSLTRTTTAASSTLPPPRRKAPSAAGLQ